MARNGAGIFSILNPIVVGASRSSSNVNGNFTDEGGEITNTLPLDGQAGMTGQFKAIDGSTAAPGIAFSADTRTGFRRSATGEMRWVGGGADRLYVNSDRKLFHLGNLDAAGAWTQVGSMTGPASDPVLISGFSSNGVARRTATTPAWSPETFPYVLHMTCGGYGTVLPVGIIGEVQAPAGGAIVSATIMLDQSGSVSVDVRKSTYANYSATVPGSSDTITGGTPLTVTSALGLRDQTLAGWITAITAGDVIRFYLNSVTSATRMTIALAVRRFS